MRAILSIFLAVLVMLMISSHDSSAAHRRSYPPKPPEQIQHALGSLNLDSIPTRNVSVTFWSSDDAASRLENIREAARARGDSSLTHIGVNISDSPELFRAYLKRDRLEGDNLQLLATGDAARQLTDAYGYSTLYR